MLTGRNKLHDPLVLLNFNFLQITSDIHLDFFCGSV